MLCALETERNFDKCHQESQARMSFPLHLYLALCLSSLLHLKSKWLLAGCCFSTVCKSRKAAEKLESWNSADLIRTPLTLQLFAPLSTYACCVNMTRRARRYRAWWSSSGKRAKRTQVFPSLALTLLGSRSRTHEHISRVSCGLPSFRKPAEDARNSDLAPHVVLRASGSSRAAPTALIRQGPCKLLDSARRCCRTPDPLPRQTALLACTQLPAQTATSGELECLLYSSKANR